MTLRDHLARYSLATLLTLATIATVVGMLLLTGLTFAALLLRSQLDDRRDTAITQANVAASTVSAAMRFGGRDVIAEALRVFDTGPSHDSVAVYDRNGKLVAELIAPGESQFPAAINALPARASSLLDVAPVRHVLRDEFSANGTAALGTLVVNPNQQVLSTAVTRVLGILAAVLVVASVVGFVIARLFSRAILRPVADLTKWAEEVAVTRNLSAPAPRGHGPEVYRLTESFEALIAQVAEQNRELKRKQYELKTANAHLESLAYSDALTGLPNRSMFEGTLATLLNRANSGGRQLALIFIDLDDLKSINDRYGHAQGDAALRATSARIRRALRGTDFLARLAGDEFVVISPNVSSESDAVKLGERLTVWLGIALPEDQWAKPIRTSIGVAVFPDHAEDAAALIQAADLATYKAKALPADDSIRVVKAAATSRPAARATTSNVIALPAQGRKTQTGKTI